MKHNGTMPLIRRQVFAVFAASAITSISSLLLVIIWDSFGNGEPDWRTLPRDFLFLLVFVVPIAGAGITFFGLPLLFVVRRLGWISTVTRFNVFGAIAGATWAMIAGLLLTFRLEALWFVALIGSINGLIVAWIWSNVVDRFRAVDIP